MCSVRTSPIPSAPNFLAISASLGVSAFVLTLNLRNPSAQVISVPKSPDRVGSTTGTAPIITCPVLPFNEIMSPSFTTVPLHVNVFAFSFIVISSQPDTQHLPIPLATTAACEVIPPLAVNIPAEECIPSISSGEVSNLARITFSPFSAIIFASSALNTTLPTAAPGEAGKPSVSIFAFFNAVKSNCLCNN